MAGDANGRWVNCSYLLVLYPSSIFYLCYFSKNNLFIFVNLKKIFMLFSIYVIFHPSIFYLCFFY